MRRQAKPPPPKPPEKLNLDELKEKFKVALIKKLIKIVVTLVILFAVSKVWQTFDYVLIPLYNTQMEPSFSPSESRIGDRIHNYHEEINHGDVVYYEFPYGQPKFRRNVLFLARVVGLPGDRIGFKGGRLYRNGESIPEVHVPEDSFGKEEFPEIIVPRNHVYLLIDKRRRLEQGIQYRDSRYWGPILIYAIKGKVE